MCRLQSGDPIVHFRRGTYLDLASEYAEIVESRLLELAAMGSEAFFFDSYHMPEIGCRGGAIEQGFVAETGLTVPEDASSENHEAWIRYKADFLTAYFEELSETIHEQFPHVAMVISNATLAGLFSQQTTTQLAADDIGKSEFTFATRFDEDFFESHPDVYEPHADFRAALGWTVLRDASDGAPPHIWMASFPNEAHIRAFTASIITYGGVANIDVPEANLLVANDPEGTSTRATVAAGMALGNQLSGTVAGKATATEVAILFSESQRDALPSLASRCTEVIGPVIGAYEAFRTEHRSVNVIADWQLADPDYDLQRFEVVFVTQRSTLSVDQESALSQFEASGGVVIENNPSWQWSTPDGITGSKEALLQVLNSVLPARLQSTGGSAHVHIQMHVNPDDATDRTILIANDFRFVQSLQGLGADGVINDPPPPIDDLQLLLSCDAGFDELTAPDLIATDVLGDVVWATQKTAEGWLISVPEFTEAAAIHLQLDVSSPATMRQSEQQPLQQAVASEMIWSDDENWLESNLEFDAADVNRDGRVSALDALVLINHLSRTAMSGIGGFSAKVGQSGESLSTLDVNQDGDVSAIDALHIIKRCRSLGDERVALFSAPLEDDDHDDHHNFGIN
ncbi:dockerin type I domain-containing protein [Rubripirellula amarantea]|nr:dockerin type I domain-containing protein [Rubripirellula amarantea]